MCFSLDSALQGYQQAALQIGNAHGWNLPGRRRRPSRHEYIEVRGAGAAAALQPTLIGVFASANAGITASANWRSASGEVRVNRT